MLLTETKHFNIDRTTAYSFSSILTAWLSQASNIKGLTRLLLYLTIQANTSNMGLIIHAKISVLQVEIPVRNSCQKPLLECFSNTSNISSNIRALNTDFPNLSNVI